MTEQQPWIERRDPLHAIRFSIFSYLVEIRVFEFLKNKKQQQKIQLDVENPMFY